MSYFNDFTPLTGTSNTFSITIENPCTTVISQSLPDLIMDVHVAPKSDDLTFTEFKD